MPVPKFPNPKILGFRFLARVLAKPGGVLTPPYLPGSPAHSAGPTQNYPRVPFCAQSVGFFWICASFLRSQKSSKNHIVAKRPRISKIQPPGDFRSHFDHLLEPFRRPFFISFDVFWSFGPGGPQYLPKSQKGSQTGDPRVPQAAPPKLKGRHNETRD